MMIAQKAQSVYQNITQYFSTTDDISLLKNQEILEIGSILNSLSVTNKDINIEVPRIVVVGTQSSGKSSVINRILKMDILPVGKQMVTRTPLHLELIMTNKNNALLEFGHFLYGGWTATKKIELDILDPTIEQVSIVKNTIEKITNEKAGNNKNISDKPIYIRVYSPNVPNLSLIDLPGLTMVACKDKGQPEDIKEQIRALVGKYIKTPQTIILAVMAARSDLETDMGLDLIKKYDPSGIRTIGVISKVDLMNKGSDVCDYLENNISKDLQLNYGYYAIKNRDLNEREKYTALESFGLEKSWFSKHTNYNKCVAKNNIGLNNLENTISKILIHKIKTHLPEIQKIINEKLVSTEKQLTQYGTPIGNTQQEKQTMLYYLVSELNTTYTKALEERGFNYNIGRQLKEIFINFRKNITKQDPFCNKTKITDEYIQNCILNCEGNHMSSLSLPIDVIEFCLRDNKHKPLWKIQKMCESTTKAIYNNLVDLITIILKEPKYQRFPQLITTIKTEIIDKMLNELLNKTNGKVLEYITIEENYIWTDEHSFMESFQKILKKNNFLIDINGVRTLLSAYYNTYLETMKTVVPKMIMYHMVTQSEKMISSNLFKQITNNKDFLNLLQEIPEIEKKRKALVSVKLGLEKAKLAIKNIN